MVATFVDNKLVLIGGVGKYRIKLTSVHILDIHTGVDLLLFTIIFLTSIFEWNCL